MNKENDKDVRQGCQTRMSDKDWKLHHNYKKCWEQASELQRQVAKHIRVVVIYDDLLEKWRTACLDLTKPITKSFRGGHRKTYKEQQGIPR